MFDFIEKHILTDFAPSTGRRLILGSDPGLRCAYPPPQHAKTARRGSRVLGYYRFSLREKERPTVFHLPWIGFAGGGLIQNLLET